MKSGKLLRPQGCGFQEGSEVKSEAWEAWEAAMLDRETALVQWELDRVARTRQSV